jgi:hypothetical protein
MPAPATAAAPQEPAPAPTAPPAPRTDPAADPLVRKAMELLNARIVDIKPKPPKA